MSISTRISAESSQHLRAMADRTGKTLGQVLDDLIAHAATHPTPEEIVPPAVPDDQAKQEA